MKKLFLLLFLTSIILNSYGQQQRIDSLAIALKKHQSAKTALGLHTTTLYDTNRVKILFEISRMYLNSDLPKAIDYINQCLILSEQIGYKKGSANAYDRLGAIYSNKGEFLLALSQQQKSIDIKKEIGDKKSLAISYSQIGRTYYGLGNYPRALDNILSSLHIGEENRDTANIISSHVMIGNIYDGMGNESESLKNFLIALKMAEEVADESSISATSNNIGVIYSNQGKYAEALSLYSKAMKINKKTGNKNYLGLNVENIGDVHFKQNRYKKAIEYYMSALQIAEEIGNKEMLGSLNISIGAAYTNLHKYNEALTYLNRGSLFSNEIGSLEGIKKYYSKMASLDSVQGNFEQAMVHYKLYIIYRDSIRNNENVAKTVTMQLNYDFNKLRDSTEAEQTKKDLIAVKELQKQKLMRNGFIGGFAVMLIFAGIFFNQRNKTKKQKQNADIQRDEADRQRVRSDELLLNILPSEVAEELKANGKTDAKQFEIVTVMFTDFKNFTQISEKLSPKDLVEEIHSCFEAFDHIIGRHNIEKIKTIGDAYMCAGGLPVANTTHAIDVVNAAIEILQFMKKHNEQQKINNKELFEIRIGIHTGPVVAGIVGVRKFAYDIWGDTVNIASRMESSGEEGKINISGSTYKLVKDQFNCTFRGKVEAKNKGQVDMYFVGLS